MLFTYRPAMKVAALCLGLAVMRASVAAVPAMPSRKEETPPPQTGAQLVGRLITRERKPITVNGTIVSTDATILTDSRIQTPDGVGATIILENLATIEIGPNTDLVLDFSSGRVRLDIKQGCVRRTRIEEGVDYSELTPTGEPVQKKDGKTICVGAIAIAAGAEAIGSSGSGTGKPGGDGGGLFGLSLAATVATLGAVVAAITGAIIGTRNNQDETPPVISPMR